MVVGIRLRNLGMAGMKCHKEALAPQERALDEYENNPLLFL